MRLMASDFPLLCRQSNVVVMQLRTAILLWFFPCEDRVITEEREREGIVTLVCWLSG